MKAILFTATRAVDRDRTSADAICGSYAELPAIIDRLAGEGRGANALPCGGAGR
jgi:hypothetical protein